MCSSKIITNNFQVKELGVFDKNCILIQRIRFFIKTIDRGYSVKLLDYFSRLCRNSGLFYISNYFFAPQRQQKSQ